MNHADIEEREQEALYDLDDAKERIGQIEEDLRLRDQQIANLQRDIAEITQLAVDYKEANIRLEEELREFHAKDGGRTREHNLLVQENRRLREALNAIAHHPGADSDHNELDSGEWRDALVQIAREALKPTK